jgi:hypothetical protein
MYPQGDAPGSWPQYNQQPYPQDPYQQQPTVPLPPPYGYPAQPVPGPGMPARPSRSRAPLIIVSAVLGVLVLMCAVGIFVARLAITADDDTGSERADPPPGTSASEEPTAPPATADGTASPTEESVEGDLARFNVGDCLTITGPENTVNPAACSASGAYKVLLRRDGTTDEKVCDSTDATEILYQDGAGTSRDLVLCVVETN